MEALAKLAIVTLVVFAAAIGSGTKKVNADQICGVTIDQIMTCKPAVAAPDSAPPEECCAALKQVRPPSCLCQYQSYLPAFGIDKKVAMQLPERCKLENAKSFHCHTN